MGSDSTPHVEVLYEVGVRKGVLGDVPRPGKDGETNGEGSGDAENRCNKENEEVRSNVGRKKRGRPSEKDKEGLSVSKKAKISPPKKKNLKIKIKTNRNNIGKPNNFSESYVKSVTEKCVFCHNEHLRDFLGGNGGEWSRINKDPNLQELPRSPPR